MERGGGAQGGRGDRAEMGVVRQAKKKVPAVSARVFGEDRPIGFEYRTFPQEVGDAASSGPEKVADALALVLACHATAEARARRCLIGPQRDDVDVTLGGLAAASFASAGEQRRTAFVLVMAAMELAMEAGTTSIVMLVDDVEAEFDDERLDRVLEFLGGATQTLVATSKSRVAERYAPLGRVIHVEEGRFRDADVGRAPYRQGAID